MTGLGESRFSVGMPTVFQFGNTGEPIQPYSALRIAAAALAAYHGYKRNNSLGWAIAWAFLGSSFPVITVPVALAQGFGQPKHRSNRRRSRRRSRRR